MKLFGVTSGQFVKIGLIALVFIVLAKWGAEKVNVPGLSAFVERA